MALVGNRKYFGLIVLCIAMLSLLFIDWEEKFLLPVSFPYVAMQSDPDQDDDVLLFEDKLWLHQVNDHSRLANARDKFTGIEIDVHYSTINGEWFVSHDPDPKHYLLLDDLLGSVDDIEEYNIWLDLKNLDNHNYEHALLELDSVCDRLDLDPDNIIVESPHPYYLADYKEAGYNTSYYLPTVNPYDMSDQEIMEYVGQVDSVLMKTDVDFLSANYKLYHVIRFYFPEARMLLWQTHRNLLTPYLRNKILDDPNVQVLLVRK